MSDRVALIDLFTLTAGKYWYQKWNWDSNLGYKKWFGIDIDSSGHVVSINLRENNLRGSITDFHSISLLVNLSTLSLFSNSITGSLPSEIGLCSYLQEINISWNQVTGDLPDSIYDLTQLRLLKIDHNQITGVIKDRLSELKELRYLDISHNQLSGEIPLIAHQLEYLTTLNLNHNHFT
eukprot:gene18326-21367_t